MLQKARAKRRVARLWLTVFPLVVGLLLGALSLYLTIFKKVSLVLWTFPFFLLVCVLSILPNDV